MKERYNPTQPLKVGFEVTSIIGKSMYKAVEQPLKRKAKRDLAKFLDLISGDSF